MAGDLSLWPLPVAGDAAQLVSRCSTRCAVLLVLPCRNGTSRPLIQHAVFVEFCGALAAAWEVQMAQLLVP
jgi:hypothetical protein